MTPTDDFNPYRKWLGIPEKDLPPNHYRLLGIELFEEDPDVIESAADARMAHLRTFQTGKRAELSQQILNEVSAAQGVLLDNKKRAAYDERLLAEKKKAAPAPPKAATPKASKPIPPPPPDATESPPPPPAGFAEPPPETRPAPAVVAPSKKTSRTSQRTAAARKKGMPMPMGLELFLDCGLQMGSFVSKQIITTAITIPIQKH